MIAVVPDTTGETDPDPWKEALAAAVVDVGNALGTATTTSRTPLFTDAHNLFDREFLSTPWMVTGLMTRGGVAQFGALPKSCKTWLATEFAVAVATGTKVCGEYFAQHGRVAYFFAEDLDRQIRNRIRALLAGRGLEPAAVRDRLHVCPRGITLDVTRDEDLAWVVASVRQLGAIDLLVLDPLRDIHSGKENESDDMSKVMRRLKMLGTLLNCTVAFAHHNKKPGPDARDAGPGEQSRGSGAIWGSTDSGIYFGIRGGDGTTRFELDVRAQVKGAASAAPFRLTLNVLDDGGGEAERASWLVERATADDKEAKAAAANQKDSDAVVARVVELAATGEYLSCTGLRDAVANVPDKRVRAAVIRETGKRLAIRDVTNRAGKTLKDRVVPL